MKDAYDKLKILSEVLKNNWPMIILACTALSSMMTNASQYMTNSDHEIEKKASQEQIAAIANHYAATTTPKIVVQKSPCGDCSILLNDHIRRLH